MTGNGISVHTVKDLIAALHKQRQHKIDKDDRCTKYKLLCSLTMVKTMTSFYTRTLADTVIQGRRFCAARKFGLLVLLKEGYNSKDSFTIARNRSFVYVQVYVES